MTRIRVVVTAADIAGAIRWEAAQCPLARALRRDAFPDARVYPVHRNGGHWVPGKNRRSYPLTKRAGAYATAFDEGEPVKSDIFYLEGPDR